ncbi:MAG TPA: hypothetical protein VHF69_10870 [Candidatus Synoicihabitans sp.]|nr:hypothetical protein [Candidatus Synoicihabitans sp.]
MIAAKLHALHVELVELAYELDRRGRAEAADVALATSARVAELVAELEARLEADALETTSVGD